MQFTTFALSALSIGSALAAGTTVHVVKVGSSNGTIAYSPNNVTAAVGDMVQFQFAGGNHTVTQSTFDQPCQPIAMNSNVTGVFSGFMPVSASTTSAPTYTIQINSTTPMWIYCSQAKHCQAGMNLVINENTKANATRSLANFKALAAKATANLAPSTVTNGTAGTSSSTGSGSATTSSGAAKSTSTSGATAFKASEALTLGGVLAAGLAVLF